MKQGIFGLRKFNFQLLHYRLKSTQEVHGNDYVEAILENQKTFFFISQLTPYCFDKFHL